MKIERVFVAGFEPALRGMRNPLESWDKSDTTYGPAAAQAREEAGHSFDPEITCREQPFIGPNDMKLACKLIKAGSDHRKFMRQIMIWWDITIPRYLWQEVDTHKVATVRNSCSTMHKLGHRDLLPEDFQDSDVDPLTLQLQNAMGDCYRNKLTYTVDYGNKVRDYAGNDLLVYMKRRLPEGFLQMATYSFSYETALNMYHARRGHRMPEWSAIGGICDWLLRLPYFSMFVNATG